MAVLFGPSAFSEHQNATSRANVKLKTLYSFQSAPQGLSLLFCRPLFQKQEPKRLHTGLCSANEASTADLIQCKEGEDNHLFLYSAWTWREKRSCLGFLFDVGETRNCSWCRAQIPYLLRSEIPPNSYQASFWRTRGREKASHVEKNKSDWKNHYKVMYPTARFQKMFLPNSIYSWIYTSRSQATFFPRKIHTH